MLKLILMNWFAKTQNNNIKSIVRYEGIQN